MGSTRLFSWVGRGVGLLSLLGLMIAGAAQKPAQAQSDFADPAFESVWQRSEQPIANGLTERSWLWGPEPRTEGLWERYIGAPDDERRIQYFDKGRMEINDPSGDPADEWHVTSGLLTRELISGRLQVDDTAFVNTGEGADVPVAGDHTNTFPTYADIGTIVDQGSADRMGEHADLAFTADQSDESPGGTLIDNSAPLRSHETEFVEYVSYAGKGDQLIGYNIPRAFWNFMNQDGLISTPSGTETADPLYDWLFVLGYPLSDPVWVDVHVGGVEQWVLVQPFERRVLTYTPGNRSAWQVEMGNIGLHYHNWRYEHVPPAELNDNRDYYGLADGATWRYGTSIGTDERWMMLSPSRSFAGHADLAVREQLKWDGHRRSYWSTGDDGLHLYGRELLDGEGNIRDVTMYWPPVQFLPGGDLIEGTVLTTDTSVVSIMEPPRDVTVEVRIEAFQLVGTPSGTYPSYRLNITEHHGDEEEPYGSLSGAFWFSRYTGIVQWIVDDESAQLMSTSTPSE